MIKSFAVGPIETNAVVLACPKTKKAVIFDPGFGSKEPILAYLSQENLQAEKILLTHTHWDHIGDCKAVADALNIPVYVHELDAPNLRTPGSDQVMTIPGLEIEGMEPAGLLDEGQVLEVGELTLKVLHTPGHCRGMCCFYCKELGALISGDLLFAGGMGRVDLPTSEPEKMGPSLAKVAALPPDTLVYPGHGPTTFIGNEF